LAPTNYTKEIYMAMDKVFQAGLADTDDPLESRDFQFQNGPL